MRRLRENKQKIRAVLDDFVLRAGSVGEAMIGCTNSAWYMGQDDLHLLARPVISFILGRHGPICST